MKKHKNKFTAFGIAIGLFSGHFVMDTYKIGIKDGKATKMAMVKGQRLNK